MVQYTEVSLQRLNIRRLEEKILKAADANDEQHFNLWSALLEKMEETLLKLELAEAARC